MAVSSTAHLCPPWFNGCISCCVNRLINQLCRVITRLFNHRFVGVGSRSHGMEMASVIRGIPISVGLMNWSKKLRFMVKFRAGRLVFLCFGWLVHLGRCGQ